MASSSTTTNPSKLSTVIVANFVSAKLSSHDNKNGDNKKSNNYLSWKEQVLCLIGSQDLLRFIDGTIPSPQFDNVSNNVLWRTDRTVKGWILGALSDPVLQTVAKLSNARDVWLELEKQFSQSEAITAHPPQAPAEAGIQDEWRKYLPLYRATLLGNWDEAKRIIDKDPHATSARIAFTMETCLHIAVGTGKAIHFVRNLVKKMPEDLLGIKDELGYTALHVATLTGNIAAAEILVGKSRDLLCMTDNKGNFPVHLAALSANRETLKYLISKTEDYRFPSPYRSKTGLKLLCIVIDAEIYDVALELATKYPELARIKMEDGRCALQRIALKDSAFSSGERQFNFWGRFLYKAVPRAKEALLRKQTHEQVLGLVKSLCQNMDSLDYQRASEIYVDVMLIAARLGVHEVIEEVVATFPAAIYSRNLYTKQYIFHVAVENRCEKVYNLTYQTSGLKHQYSDLVDSGGNTLLHLAGRLAPPHKLNVVSGAALQMQRELQWFMEVRKFVLPYSRERTNKDGKTPKMVFTEAHQGLKVEGEKWMKDTANSCSIAAALIATIVFAADITVPGGTQDHNGYPIFSSKVPFIIFAISDAISLFTSTTSLLMFLSILTSRYAEKDFLYALPKRLCIGLFMLFVSISFMMVAFAATIFLVFCRMKAWILIPVGALFCLPITSFVLLQFPLLVEVISNTYGCGIFGKQSNLPFY